MEWADIFNEYDVIYYSKVFTFSAMPNMSVYRAKKIVGGGTGIDIRKKLPNEIENHLGMDYSIYPKCNFSIQFFSRGCIRRCPFCLVHDKEGDVRPVTPVELNPKGEWIEVLDNNFFANPKWREAVEYLKKTGKKVKLHGVDLRIMNEEQAMALKSLKHYRQPHIAWDMPNVDLRPQLTALSKYIRPSAITCYVLVGFNSTLEQDLFRIRTLKEMGFTPFAQPYRDFENKRKMKWYENDLSRWCNNHFFLKSCDFTEFEPRKGFKCQQYFDHPELRELVFYKSRKPPILK